MVERRHGDPSPAIWTRFLTRRWTTYCSAISTTAFLAVLGVVRSGGFCSIDARGINEKSMAYRSATSYSRHCSNGPRSRSTCSIFPSAARSGARSLSRAGRGPSAIRREDILYRSVRLGHFGRTAEGLTSGAWWSTELGFRPAIAASCVWRRSSFADGTDRKYRSSLATLEDLSVPAAAFFSLLARTAVRRERFARSRERAGHALSCPALRRGTRARNCKVVTRGGGALRHSVVRGWSAGERLAAERCEPAAPRRAGLHGMERWRARTLARSCTRRQTREATTSESSTRTPNSERAAPHVEAGLTK